MMPFITNNLLWTQGWGIIIALCIIAGIGLKWFKPLFFFSLILFTFSLYFFRSPERYSAVENDHNNILCPADGIVVDITYDKNNSLRGFSQKISIFLSVFDVHVQWMPISGTIEKIEYVAGSFLPAFLPKSSDRNEHADVVVIDAQQRKIMIRQIAGIIARRICWWVQEGQPILAGQKYGMIKFGSRVDVFLPDAAEIVVGLGQKVYGGQTILARWQ